MKKSNLVLLAALLLCCSCAKVPYSPTPVMEDADSAKLVDNEPQIARGEPNSVIDAVGKYQPFSLLAKLLLWNWKIENHDISPDTEAVLKQYIADNNLQYVKVYVNRYAPDEELSSLNRNQSVAWGWRWTLGLVNLLFYTVLPGRVFGGDGYNPYTNSVYLYSDHPAVAVHEGGHAKDFAQREWKGTNAALYMLPLVALYYEAQATGDAVGYFRERPCKQLEKDGYKVLYPAYLTYAGGEAVNLVAASPLLALAAVIPGHIAGRIKAGEVNVDEKDPNLCIARPASWAKPSEGERSLEAEFEVSRRDNYLPLSDTPSAAPAKP